MLKVTFDTPLAVTLHSGKLAVATTVAEAEIVKVTYYPGLKVAHAELDVLPGNNLMLWSKAEYDAAGQWTDADVVARVKSKKVTDQIKVALEFVPQAILDSP